MCSIDPTFRALQHDRRRNALCFVQTHQTVALPDLAELVTEREAGAEVTSLPPERVRDVYFSLYHTHLPVLRDANLLRYEQEADRVVATEEASTSLAAAREAIDELITG